MEKIVTYLTELTVLEAALESARSQIAKILQDIEDERNYLRQLVQRERA